MTKNVNKYLHIILDEFYLDADENVRRKKDGYHMRFKQHDLATFHIGQQGYHYIQIPQGVRRRVTKHEIVWVLVHGAFPVGKMIDHRDGNPDNNRSSNLRLVTHLENNRNRKKRADNTSGVTGIRWSDYHKHYVIRRTVGSKRLSRSRKTFDEALAVLEDLKQMDTTYTSRHGK
ncbi:hypothetical protein NVP1188A_68 [Vibrio phage 1.188.A._10N.286.51.A6]|uniref:HNH nuclease domain-containing protein n=6 Tax=Mukerjeevirus TaxID=2733146 RepID=A0A2I7REL3_9CAUD|nr:HNH endonuclease [Vibrio phage 1.169.O._10N.261.52.B1]YP_009817527.1 HNH endonuclease [Vibrio phage 1.188.A._10N.286.51.A6]YP_009817668.1 HNH endonuclease [Vibrio phage 1.224.A._10N.261.48.B1]YP_009817750.1 HNH endonuclease [Vibrio phage 1.261.O._10N.286.51.A7]AUR93722.1 hypothetical protein NVP1188B_68 [Vibrio phage 1.188.B._10N.286.51.A6]AUR93808.1 hypothetical protein NVP1188C_68 [Vibrio phage 1.188.C._10N.286.51.A6]AUR92079.1 hypothetical protein NVP1169O_51 [Vibrio phage 1.169.O._10N.